MKIQAAKVIVTCPGRNFVTLKITTDQGVHGIGDATLNGRELSVVSYLEDHVIPCLIGRDPRQIEDIWQYLYRGAYWRRGPVTMSAVAAVDTALWDIKAKMANMPLYDLLLQVGDLKAAAEFATAHGLVSLIDNTFASPVNFRPPEWGFDLSLHSGTKYLNGHSDIVAGAIIGRGELVNRVKHKLDHLGGSLDPHACFLLHRGMKTLAIRVRYQNESALRIARFLEQHPKVAKVNYPGLAGSAGHARAREWFDGFGGMLSFELKGGVQAAESFTRHARLPVCAPSLGGVETLLTRPATTSHAGMSPADRKRLGITDSLIRVSIGIEATEDILEDFAQALDS